MNAIKPTHWYQPLLSLVVALSVATTTSFAFQQPKGAAGTAKSKATAKVDLNQASVDELAELPGVGPAIAKAIIAARPFKSVDDLERVKGLGPAKIAAMRDRVTVAPAEAPKAKAEPAKAVVEKKDAGPTTKVDLNKAKLSELEELPGVGPAIGKEIVAARPFQSVDDLERIKGLGPAKIAALRSRVTVAPAEPPKAEATKAEAPKAEAPKAEMTKKAATKAEAATKKAVITPGKKVDINTASKEELDALPGIGPVKAQAIIDARPYKSVDDLVRAKGIGSATLEKLRPFIEVK